MAVCRSCGAEITWAKTSKGKMMPVDVSSDPEGNIVLYDRLDPEDSKFKWFATILGPAEDKPEIVYTSHFKTCPNANQHRKKPEKEEAVARQEGDILKYKDLLEMASQQGIEFLGSSIHTIPSEHNGMYAACEAHLKMKDGREFKDVGDASPESVQRTIVPHILRMASTRAKARCLRDAMNYGDPVLEEFHGGDMTEGAETPPARKPAPVQSDATDEDYEADMKQAMDIADEQNGHKAQPDEDEETQESVMKDIEALIMNAPKSKVKELPSVEEAMKYAGRSYEYAVATRQRINNKLKGVAVNR